MRQTGYILNSSLTSNCKIVLKLSRYQTSYTAGGFKKKKERKEERHKDVLAVCVKKR